MVPNIIDYQWQTHGDVVIADGEERIFNVDNLSFSRSKDNKTKDYQIVGRIAVGSFREIYEIHSSFGKFKAIKLSFSDNINSQKESQILRSLNSQGRQTGISKPDKAFFSLPSGVNVQIMPKYHQSLLSYLVGEIGLNEDITELLKNCKIPDQQIIQMLKQIVSGLMYLKERSVFHGDVELRNILCSLAVPIRFDLMDFEDGVDLSKVNTVEELFSQLSEHNRNHCMAIRSVNPSLSDSQCLEACKRWLLSQDALSFAMMLENHFIHLMKHESNLVILREIIALVNSTQSIEGVFAKLQHMQDPSETISTIQHYAKSKYE